MRRFISREHLIGIGPDKARAYIRRVVDDLIAVSGAGHVHNGLFRLSESMKHDFTQVDVCFDSAAWTGRAHKGPQAVEFGYRPIR